VRDATAVTHTQNKQSNNPFLRALGYVGEKLLRHTHTHTNPHVGAKDQSLIMEHPAAHSRNSALNFAQHRQESPEHTHTHTHRGSAELWQLLLTVKRKKS